MHRKFVITTKKELCEYTFCKTQSTSSGQSTFGEFYIVSEGPTNQNGQKCPSSPSIVKCGLKKDESQEKNYMSWIQAQDIHKIRVESMIRDSQT